jgi:hypothetical protein
VSAISRDASSQEIQTGMDRIKDKDEGGRMRDEREAIKTLFFILPPSSFILALRLLETFPPLQFIIIL